MQGVMWVWKCKCFDYGSVLNVLGVGEWMWEDCVRRVSMI